MRLNFCTLFDSGYLSRGLALYASLVAQASPFHLVVLAMDDAAYVTLTRLDLADMTVVSLSEVEDTALLHVKPTRSRGEYCWTCTPCLLDYAFRTYGGEMWTYVDADLYFFSDPRVLIEEMGSASVLITPHRYTQRYDQSAVSGIYCVQFMTFCRTAQGLAVLDWWRNACLDWCFAVPEQGKFGDQKYLDDWPERFEGVHVLQHLGGGVAPWNVQQYQIYTRDGQVRGKELRTGVEFPVVFYHFHALHLKARFWVDYGAYALRWGAKWALYRPYIKALREPESGFSEPQLAAYATRPLKASAGNAWIHAQLLGPDPVMIGRIGGVEWSCVMAAMGQQGRESPRFKKGIRDQMIENAGFFPPTHDQLARFSAVMVASVGQVDGVAVWGKPHEPDFMAQFCPQAALFPLRSLDGYRFEAPWTAALAGKKVLVIHPFVETIAAQYARRDRLFENPHTLPEFELKLLKAVQSVGGEPTPYATWFEALEAMIAQVQDIDFEIALIGAGAYGFPLAAAIKKMGKKAVHIGGSTQILFGIKGRRWDADPVVRSYYNAYWARASVAETPQFAQKVEGATYW